VGVLTIASVRLPAEPRSVPRARELAAGVAADLPMRIREAVELVTSELATNCVTHAGTPFEVFVARDDDSVEVVLSDSGPWTHRPQGRATGHGLLLVGLLASSWSAQVVEGGKRVSARLQLDDVPTY